MAPFVFSGKIKTSKNPHKISKLPMKQKSDKLTHEVAFLATNALDSFGFERKIKCSQNLIKFGNCRKSNEINFQGSVLFLIVQKIAKQRIRLDSIAKFNLRKNFVN